MLPCIGWVYRRQLVFVLCKVLTVILPAGKRATLITRSAERHTVGGPAAALPPHTRHAMGCSWAHPGAQAVQNKGHAHKVCRRVLLQVIPEVPYRAVHLQMATLSSHKLPSSEQATFKPSKALAERRQTTSTEHSHPMTQQACSRGWATD